MANPIIEKFTRGKWFSKSNSILGNKFKMAAVMAMLPKYLKKGGLRQCKDDLVLLSEYINDILHGRYKQYDHTALTLAVAGILYVVSPLDIVPDMLPAGLLDDVTIIAWAMAQMGIELGKYSLFRQMKKSGASNVMLESQLEDGPAQEEADAEEIVED